MNEVDRGTLLSIVTVIANVQYYNYVCNYIKYSNYKK